jgi:hypothetical protein
MRRGMRRGVRRGMRRGMRRGVRRGASVEEHRWRSIARGVDRSAAMNGTGLLWGRGRVCRVRLIASAELLSAMD